MSSLLIDVGPLGKQPHDECGFCPLNQYLSHRLCQLAIPNAFTSVQNCHNNPKDRVCPGKISPHRSILTASTAVILPIWSSHFLLMPLNHTLQWLPNTIQNWRVSLWVCGLASLIMWFPELVMWVGDVFLALPACYLLLYKQSASNGFPRPLLMLWAPLLQLFKYGISLDFLFF